jgi:hypothetical protein
MMLLFFGLRDLGGLHTDAGSSPTMGGRAKDSMSKAKSAAMMGLSIVNSLWVSDIVRNESVQLPWERDRF